jgi:4-amino-4-deoxy-L-arabinose transferase-like glycosyltransferase
MTTSTTSTTSQRIETPATRTAGWFKPALLIGAALIVAFLFLYNLTNYPKTWYDEGSHLHVPKALVTMGVYADYSSEGLRHFGPTLGVGPTVLLPIAGAFEVAGIGLLQARLVMVTYLVVALVLMFLLARHLLGVRAAWVVGALLITSPAIDMVEFGRQVLGEVPGLAFMAGGFLLWFVRWRRARWWELILVGLLLGLSVVTKYQYLLVLGAALLLAWGMNLLWFKRPQRLFLIPGIVTAATFGAWQLFTLVYLGAATIGENFAALREVSAGAAAVFSQELMIRSLGELFSAKSFLWLLFPVLAYSLYWLARPHGVIAPRPSPLATADASTTDASTTDDRRYQLAILYGLVILNLLWYVVASVSWLRYAFLGLSFATFFVTLTFANLTTNFDVAHLWRSARSGGSRWRGYAGLALLLLLAAMIVAPGARLAVRIATAPPDDSAQMAQVMNATVPLDALVETWEQPMGFLTDHRYHYPPQLLLNRTVRQKWLGEAGVAEFYDFTELNPEYVLVGEFARWVGIYPPDRLQAAGYESVETLGQYELYQRR